jgi:hypothetical protein
MWKPLLSGARQGTARMAGCRRLRCLTGGAAPTNGWMAPGLCSHGTVRRDGGSELHTFARGIRQDYTALRNGLTLPHNSSACEGQATLNTSPSDGPRPNLMPHFGGIRLSTTHRGSHVGRPVWTFSWQTRRSTRPSVPAIPGGSSRPSGVEGRETSAAESLAQTEQRSNCLSHLQPAPYVGMELTPVARLVVDTYHRRRPRSEGRDAREHLWSAHYGT